MPNLPRSKVTISAEAGALAGGTGYCVVLSCVEKNADLTPRPFSSWKNIFEKHGYSQGLDYSALHIEEAQQPVLFVALPTATPGAVGRQNSSGVTGSCAISVAAGANGILEETEGIFRVTKGGTIGTSKIEGELSLDAGFTFKKVRLGTGNSYVVPYLGIVLNFGAGTLNVDDEYTFVTTGPKWDADGIAAAKAALANQLRVSRTWLLMGDVAANALADSIVAAANGYQTGNDRYVLARVQLRDRLPLASMSKVTKRMTGAPNLTFTEVGGTGDTVARSSGSWIDDGFAVGDIVTIGGAVASAGANNVTGPIASLTASTITFGTTDLVNEGPIGGCTVTASPGLTFTEVGGTGDTIARSSGSWLDDGFRAGDEISVEDTVSNNVTGVLTNVTNSTLTFGSTDLANEVIRSDAVTITKGETETDWLTDLDDEFGDITSEPRVDFAVGRATKQSLVTGWTFRRPAQWAVSIREYQHDVHIATWEKDFGPLEGWGFDDADGVKQEFDDRGDGGSAGGITRGFTCLRTWGNGPLGVFVAMSLTRAEEDSPLQFSHNMQVANVACAIVQSKTENAIGRSLILDPKTGRATEESLRKFEESVNSDLETALMNEKVLGEGPRASLAVWRASRTDDLRGTNNKLNGAGDLALNGTLVEVGTLMRVT